MPDEVAPPSRWVLLNGSDVSCSIFTLPLLQLATHPTLLQFLLPLDPVALHVSLIPFTNSSPSSPSSTFSPSFPSSSHLPSPSPSPPSSSLGWLLFTFNHDPLYPPKSLIQFIVASLSVKIKPQFYNPKKKSSVYLWIESMLFPLLINFAYNYEHALNPHVLLIVYCFIMFILIDLLVFVSNAVVGAVTGVELELPSDEPYLSTSLQDFWGRRWNLMVTNSLRHTIYKPTWEMAWS
ncbi:probable long-chain-alcohol O-fatty-acyltransferase 8 [Cynara cardunculus var. scolymus]|uniref:probable long-chain-alcohol O-fatty-acyltransferase 8 n=1 Tax=Cynara cardunculus var. scolymus TaxID=59895 RepID=UPI000D628558|nr:probable long-chain-alcohol O-fatty-acyltransferase 8 [Cynara cardunculus var. scolymus]